MRKVSDVFTGKPCKLHPAAFLVSSTIFTKVKEGEYVSREQYVYM